jgi:hypothetical protein
MIIKVSDVVGTDYWEDIPTRPQFGTDGQLDAVTHLFV